MNLLEAFEELNLLNESTDLTEAKSASDLRPFSLGKFDAWQPMRVKQSKLVSDLNSILEGKAVKNFETGEAGTMDVFGKEENMHINAMEIVARIHAIRVPADRSRYRHHKYNYILADSTNPRAKDYTIALHELVSVIQPEPTEQAVWQDITFNVRFKQRVLWDGSQKSELANYWSRYIKTENNAKDTAKIYVLDSADAAKANAVIKDFNNEISADVLQSSYWKTYKSKWEKEQQLNKSRAKTSLIKHVRGIDKTNISDEEQAELIDMIKTNNTMSKQELNQLHNDLPYLAGWIAGHTAHVEAVAPYYLIDAVLANLETDGDDNIHGNNTNLSVSNGTLKEVTYEQSLKYKEDTQRSLSLKLELNMPLIKYQDNFIPSRIKGLSGFHQDTGLIANNKFIYLLVKAYGLKFGPKQDVDYMRSKWTDPKDLEKFDSGFNAIH